MRREIVGNLDTLIPETTSESTFTAFECRLVACLLESIAVDSQRDIVRQQLAAATVTDRSFSKIGFFISLELGSNPPAADPSIRSGIGDAWIFGPSLKTGATAFLLATEGRLTCIEGVTFDGSDWPADDAIRYLLDAEPQAEIRVGNTKYSK